MKDDVPAAGTSVWIRRERWRVLAARRDQQIVQLDVTNHDRRRTFLTPFDRLERIVSRPRPQYARPQHAMARLAGVFARTGSVRAPLSLVDARIEILPHQIEPVLAVLGGARRLLIADEVGLGKTIQAGLVIAELQRRARSLRVLVIVPSVLAEQWQNELDCRFGITCRIVRRRLLEDIVRAEPRGNSPWTRAGIWLLSADYLKQPHVLDAMPRLPWDLVVIDEAHDACGDSDRHEACAEMARRARHVILLTATPHSGDAVRFGRLQRMGELGGMGDSLTVFRRTRAELDLSRPRKVRWHHVGLTSAERAVLDALASFEVRALDAAAGRGQEDAALLLLSVFRKRALSTMAALDMSIARRLLVNRGSIDREAWSQPSLDFCDADDFSDDERTGLIADIGLGATEERLWLNRLQRLVQATAGQESKIARLTRLAARTRDALVVFTEFRHSLTCIEHRLARLRDVVALHGGQTAIERRNALERFLHGGASVLIATDVAGQGLNLQGRARWVVSFELPWNPVRLEQRIGRVDRIGQRRSVHATLLIARHVAETGLLSRLAKRALEAQRTLGDGVFGDVTPPPAMSVGRALISGSDLPLPGQVDAALTLSARWRRSARAVARQMAMRRTLARRWRGSPDSGGRPLWTVSRRPAGRNSSLVIFSVPLVDTTGTVVESIVCGARIPEVDRTAAIRTARSAEIAYAVSHAVRARLRRVARVIANRDELTSMSERAIAARLSAGALSARLQPGLFDRREIRAFEAATSAAKELVQQAAEITEDSRHSRLETGVPKIELVVCGG